jgi:L-lactate dehydrogenase complex protein LldF
MQEWKHLSYASSLCGNCTEVCAVKINLHELLLENRHEAVESGYSTLAERIAWKVWRKASLSRPLMNMGTQQLKNWLVGKAFKAWTAHRDALDFAPKTFNERWRTERPDTRRPDSATRKG